MLFHIRPRLFSRFKNVALIDLEVDPLGLRLEGGIDLATRRPYPNKYYAVACRKKGHKAINGILIETETMPEELSYTARWAIDAALSVTHHVRYQLVDRDFAAASDDMMLWYACSGSLGNWTDRRPACWKNVAPVNAEPLMEVIPNTNTKPRANREDVIDERLGLIVARRETFMMPTLERERLLTTKLVDRMPALHDAFRQNGPSRPPKRHVATLDDHIPF